MTFPIGAKVMMRGTPRNPLWTCADRGIPETQFGVVYTVSWTGLACDPPWSGTPIIHLAEIDSRDHGYAAMFFMELPRCEERETLKHEVVA